MRAASDHPGAGAALTAGALRSRAGFGVGGGERSQSGGLIAAAAGVGVLRFLIGVLGLLSRPVWH